MNMTYDEVQDVILEGINRNGGCFISAIALHPIKMEMGYIPGINCNSRGFDVLEHSKQLHIDDIIRRYHLGVNVWFVLNQPECLVAFQHQFPGAEMQNL